MAELSPYDADSAGFDDWRAADCQLIKQRKRQFVMAVRVLVTGSSGHIGSIVVPALREEGYLIRGMDIVSTANEIDEFVQGDLLELTSVRKAVAGVDLVIHLAGCSDDGAVLHDLVGPNLLGVYHVLEAMRLERVRRIVLASSVHAVDIFANRSRAWRTSDRCPTTDYGLLKVAAEDMVSMYSRLHEITGLAVRLGWVPRNDIKFRELAKDPKLWNTYLSKEDLCRIFICCVRTQLDKSETIYAVSCQFAPLSFDMEPSKMILGYEPSYSFVASS